MPPELSVLTRLLTARVVVMPVTAYTLFATFTPSNATVTAPLALNNELVSPPASPTTCAGVNSTGLAVDPLLLPNMVPLLIC